MTESLIATYDYSEFAGLDEAARAEVRGELMRSCYDGKIVVLKNAANDIDLQSFEFDDYFPDEFCKVGVVNNREIQSLNSNDQDAIQFVRAGRGPLEPRLFDNEDVKLLCDGAFGGNRSRMERFGRDCRKVELDLRSIAKDVLWDYDYFDDTVVWRFGRPKSGYLHFDNTPSIKGKEALRFFVNLDDRQRIWECSLNLLDVIESEYENLNLAKYFEANDDFFSLLKKAETSSRLHAAARVRITFEPKDVWFFDARLLSHEPKFGRRALTITTKMKLRRLPQFHRPLAERLLAIHARKQKLKIAGDRWARANAFA